jgi:hypothetical protein
MEPPMILRFTADYRLCKRSVNPIFAAQTSSTQKGGHMAPRCTFTKYV